MEQDVFPGRLAIGLILLRGNMFLPFQQSINLGRLGATS
jgi:hypothetical protein